MQSGKFMMLALGIALVALVPACANVLGLRDVTAPSCSDQLRNGDETDADCGGSCGPCAAGRACGAPGDCMSSVCEASQCAAPTCVDDTKNGDETDADCGGSCKPCGEGQVCRAAIDCVSAVCAGNACQAPACDDQVKNGDETDADCGGRTCGSCGVGRACGTSVDCAGSAVCDAALCREADSCLDILQHRPGAASGVYRIMPVAGEAFSALCDMDASHDGGGWTLLLKSNGDATLAYNASYWTDTVLLNAEDLTTNPGNAKYPAFGQLPLTTLVGELDGFRYGFRPPCDGCSTPARTAQQLFSGAMGQGEAIVVMEHPAMGSGSNWSTQPNCHAFGINTPYGYSHARFGWTANQEPDCATNDTAIGLGLINNINTPEGPGITDVLGAGYLCVSSECSSGTVRTGGNGLLWGR